MLLTIITFIIVLSVIVFVHELGHFLTARKLGVKVEEFGFGFPPRIWGYKKGETIYSINWIPIGGFVKIKGEDGTDRGETDSFTSQSAARRSLILSAGVIMNVILAFILLTIGFIIGLPAAIDGNTDGIVVRQEEIQVIEVSPESVASTIGLKVGDQIISIDGQTFVSTDEMTSYIRNDADGLLNLQIKRVDEELFLSADLSGQSEKILGVYLTEVGLVRYHWYEAIVQGFKATFFILWQIIVAFYLLLKGFILGTGPGLEVAGPVGVAVLTGQMARLGFSYLLQFTALFSLNLAIINILPFPALDGGRLLFILIEKIRRKPNNEAVEGVIHNIGFILLLVLIFVITYKDIAKYGSHILEFLK